MTKPRFTPDPSPADIDPVAREWFQRQLERIHDLWPKDLEQRLAQLESLQAAKIGDWPIVDTTYCNLGNVLPSNVQTLVKRFITFSISGTDIAEGCVTNATAPIGLGVGSGNITAVYNSDPDYIVCSFGDDLIYSTTGDDGDWTRVTAATMGLQTNWSIRHIWKHDGEWFVAGAPPGTSGGLGLKIVKAATPAGSWSQHYSNLTVQAQTLPCSLVDNGTGDGRLLMIVYKSSISDTFAHHSLDNGLTWTEYGPIPNATISQRRGKFARYCNGRWYILGTRTSIWQIPDGPTFFDVGNGWGLQYTLSDQFESAMDIQYNGSIYLVTKEGGSLPELIYSFNGVSFATRLDPFRSCIYSSLEWDEECQLWSVAASTFYGYSDDDGLTWTQVPRTGGWSSLVGGKVWNKANTG